MEHYKKLPIVRVRRLADGSLQAKPTGKTGLLTMTQKVDLTPKTTKTLLTAVTILGSMYIIGGLIRMKKIA